MSDPQKPTNGQPTPGPSSPLVQQPQQFAQGFNGMATEPFPDNIRAILAETPAHEDVQIRPDGIVFMPGVWYRRQLTRAFGQGGWALAPRGPSRSTGKGMEYHGALYCLGRWVSEAVGGCESGFMSHADMIESARTDCLGKCCKDLGMASELWEKDWREAWQQEYAFKGPKGWELKQKRTPKAADLMRDIPTTASASAPTVTTAPASTVTAKDVSGTDVVLPPPSPASVDPLITSTPPVVVADDSMRGHKGDNSLAVDPLMLNARKVCRDHFKRLGFKGTEVKRWLTEKFGVDAIPKLKEEQIDNCCALLDLLSPEDREMPAKYATMLDNLRSNGKVLKEAR